MGFMPLADIFMRISIVEMKHIDKLAERILFLKGDVDLAPSGVVERIRDVEGMLKHSCGVEESSIADYNKWANEAGALRKRFSKRSYQPRRSTSTSSTPNSTICGNSATATFRSKPSATRKRQQRDTSKNSGKISVAAENGRAEQNPPPDFLSPVKRKLALKVNS